MRSESFSPIRRTLVAAMLIAMVAALSGCPYPTSFEDVYGYNAATFRNEGDRPVTSLFVYNLDAVSRGSDYLEDAPPLLPGEALTVTGLANGVYTLELGYDLTAEEAEAEDPVPTSETLPGVELFWGATYTWHWYGPDLPAGDEAPAE